MKKSSKLLALILVLALALSMALAGCTGGGKGKDSATTSTSNSTGKTYKEIQYAANTTLRMATGYNNKKTGLHFDDETVGSGLTLNGKTYNTGDLKPTWVSLGETLKINFDGTSFTNDSATNNWKALKEKLETVDMLSVPATNANEAGAQGQLIDISKYLEYMPNFDAYLDANPIVRLSITGSYPESEGGGLGAIYFSPYFDGVDDIERMPLMRTDWAVALLNGEGQFTAAASDTTAAAKYQPYMPTSGKVDVQVVDSVSAAGEPTVKTISKDYSKYGNIVQKMNEAGPLSGVTAVNMLREYIDKTYNNYYGTNRADLFIGQNAAWDADEMVALLRCVVANTATLNPELAVDGKKVTGLFSREDFNNQRTVDMYRFAGTLFGVRGVESRQAHFYFGKDGKIYDARNSADSFAAAERMHAMFEEGLISADYNNTAATTAKSENYVKQSTGFMSYDYNQTQTLWSNDTIQYRAVLVPVAHWYDGSSADGTYMRFTESWRSVKSDAWAISKAGVTKADGTIDNDKLFACLKLIDYAYSVQGQITMSYGPDEFISVKDASVEVKTKEDVAKKYNTFKFNGEDWPVITDATFADLQAKAKGNYTNFARFYLGSTLSFLKSQAFEVQCTSAAGKAGAQQISYAIAAGIIKHPLLKVNTANMWYTSMPSTLPVSAANKENVSAYETALGKVFSTSKNENNAFCQIIAGGYAAIGITGVTDAASMIEYANGTLGNQTILDEYNHPTNGPWGKLLAYYMG